MPLGKKEPAEQIIPKLRVLRSICQSITRRSEITTTTLNIGLPAGVCRVASLLVSHCRKRHPHSFGLVERGSRV